jgi:hypothetical protein
VQNVTIHGPSLQPNLAPIIFTLNTTLSKDQKVSITEDQAVDMAHELYYFEVATQEHPQGELRGRIVKSSEFRKPSRKWTIDFQKIGQDISRYAKFITSKSLPSKPMNMNMNEEAVIHPLSQNIISELKKNRPTILAKYLFYKNIPDYKTIAYRPRQFVTGLMFESSQSAVTNPGVYKGWDFLNTPNDATSQGVFTPKWISLKLNRPATVGIIWRGGEKVPQWLSSWTKSTPVEINYKSYPVYLKKQSSFEVHLGSTQDSSSKKIDSYLLLFAEENGKASSPPVIPSNLEEAKPNSICPTWVHDQYVTKGPDGEWYAAWHPQIDPVYWCYFGHEHGSDPKLFDKSISLPFGYAGAKMGMHEKHQGFKVYIWDDAYGYRFLALQHQGTSSNQAVCGTLQQTWWPH